MSTDYEIRCLTCRCLLWKDNWRDPEKVNLLLSLRVEFAAIGKRVNEWKDAWFSLDGWDAWGSMFPEVFVWFAEHAEHELVIFDEYGFRWPECPPGQHKLSSHGTFEQCDICVWRSYNDKENKRR